MSLLRLLPQELLDMVVDELASDRGALNSCSLAAPAFLSRCRKHQFFHIVVSNSSLSLRLHDILNVNPPLAGMITSLQIHEWESDGPWIPENESLPRALSMMTSLRRLSLDGFDDRSRNHGIVKTILWDALSPEMQGSFFRVFALPSLSALALSDISGLPMTFFNVLTKHLDDLSLYDISFQDSICFNIDACPPAHSFGVLEIQVLSENRQLLNLIAHPDSCLSNVQHLVVFQGSTDELGENISARILRADGDISWITWRQMGRQYLPEAPLVTSLNAMSNLQFLTYQSLLGHRDDSKFKEECNSWLAPILGTLNRPSILRTLQALDIRIDAPSYGRKFDFMLLLGSVACSEAWGILDHWLTVQNGSNVSLHVDIHTDVLKNPCDAEELRRCRQAWTSLLRQQMPGLYERGSLFAFID